MTPIHETIQRLRELAARYGSKHAGPYDRQHIELEITGALPALLEYIEKLEKVVEAAKSSGPYGYTIELQQALEELDKP